MKHERRSLYRVLHVQPEAPAEIIAAAYRCLMHKLRHHPDLGGDHATAVKINEAWSVLGDPERRRAYDQQRRQKRASSGAAGGAAAAAAAAAQAAASAAAAPGASARAAPVPGRECPFCAHGLPRVIGSDTRCSRCDSPLAPVAVRSAGPRPGTDLRGAARVRRNQAAMIRVAPGCPPVPARLHDLSLSGLSLHTDAVLAVGAHVRIVAADADVVAQVVQLHRHERTQLVHLRLLTARFSGQPGMFVSVCA